MTYTQEQLNEIIKKHGMWLRDEDGGVHANLRYADLSHANLRYASLSYADLSHANLRYADLRYADLSHANLRYASLSYADLSHASLSYADLSHADLSHADLLVVSGNRGEIKSIFASETYPITYTATVMQIGCERHEISKWKEFDDQKIINMDGKKALKFWREWKEIVFTIIEMSPAKPTATGDTK